MDENNVVMALSAFPVPGLSQLPNGDFFHPSGGMALQTYAAIALKVPRSGIPELDAMIRESRRLDAAERALQGLLADPNVAPEHDESWEIFVEIVAGDAVDISDALLAASEKEQMK